MVPPMTTILNKYWKFSTPAIWLILIIYKYTIGKKSEDENWRIRRIYIIDKQYTM